MIVQNKLHSMKKSKNMPVSREKAGTGKATIAAKLTRIRVFKCKDDKSDPWENLDDQRRRPHINLLLTDAEIAKLDFIPLARKTSPFMAGI